MSVAWRKGAGTLAFLGLQSAVINGERNKFRNAARLIIILAVYTVRLTPSHRLTPVLSPFHPSAPRDTADYRTLCRGRRIIPRSAALFLSPTETLPSHAWENMRHFINAPLRNVTKLFPPSHGNQVSDGHTENDCESLKIVASLQQISLIKLVYWFELMRQN